MPFKENFELAQRVMKEIQEKVTTSNSIIPGTDLPMIFLPEMPSYNAKFGPAKMKEIMDYQSYISKIRTVPRLSAEISKLEKEGKPSPLTTMYIAITMMGVGECADTSNLAMILLCQNSCKSPVNIINLVGKKPNDDPFEHALVVIGECQPLASSAARARGVPSFRGLGDDCVIMDPLLGVVGKANDILNIPDEMAYLTTFAVNRIDQITTVPASVDFKELAFKIYANAKTLSLQWCKEFQPYQRSSLQAPKAEAAPTVKKQIAAASVAATGVAAPRPKLGLFDEHTKSDPHSELSILLERFRSDPSNKTAFDSIEKRNYAQAIRRICTVNHGASNSEASLHMLRILLKFKDVLSIDIDEQAGEKMQTALHQTALRNNRTAYDLLIESGANPNIESRDGKKAMDYFPASMTPSTP